MSEPGTPTDKRSRQGSQISATGKPPRSPAASLSATPVPPSNNGEVSRDGATPTMEGTQNRSRGPSIASASGVERQPSALSTGNKSVKSEVKTASAAGGGESPVSAVGENSPTPVPQSEPSPSPNPTPSPAPVEEPPREPTPPAAPLTVEEKLVQAEQELAAAKSKIYSLEQQNASMQRLMSGTSSDAKIKLLNQDINKRIERIKALEAEVKKQTKRAEDAEKKASSGLSRRASRSSMNVSDKASAEKIKELQKQLNASQSKVAELSAGKPATGGTTPTMAPVQHVSQPDAGSQQLIFKLRTMLAERDAEKQMLEHRLSKAQEAIVSSAGSGFENEVKLQQARSALQSILTSQSPSRSRSPHHTDRGLSHSPAASPAKYESITSGAERPKAYYDSAGGIYNPTSAMARLSSASPQYSSPQYSVPGGYTRNVSPTRRYY
eukprot:TRINITY_DN6245_c0_g5_i1.p1 TRINITY_DN6245_c0_g5~~TRINITY_DN6245_c0_g5_i1.p1  ORF type:complete len:438 (+),score=119.40 TRINITY_DN6245_c0_g5_i1:54-1367(+)